MVFAHLDHFPNLARHMAHGSSMRMGGGMTLHEQTPGVRGVGATYRYTGRAFGMAIDFQQRVAEWAEDQRKVWRTLEGGRIILLGRYEMGFELEPGHAATRVRAWITYDLPRDLRGRVLGALFARSYARWCVRSILDGAKAALEARPEARPAPSGPRAGAA